MSDILKVTTPVINKTQQVPVKGGVDPLNPFTISDPSRVIRSHNQSDILKQNTGKNEGNDGPVTLMNLLKDPAVAVSYLKNIFLLEEIFKLLPANNQTLTPEIEQIFQSLLIPANDVDIQSELINQEKGATQFKGELFDFLRDLNASKDVTTTQQHAIATLLRSINNLSSKQDILDAVANSLKYLQTNFESSPQIFEQLDKLVQGFRRHQEANDNLIKNPLDEDTGDLDGDSRNSKMAMHAHGRHATNVAKQQQNMQQQDFNVLKEETQEVLRNIESSLLYSPKISKVASIIIYNLSRYNVNTLFFNESAFRLRQLLPAEDKGLFGELINDLSQDIRGNVFPENVFKSADSKVMDSLIKLIDNQSNNIELNATESAKIDNMIHSLLSSPCNFTPLLHFIVPATHNDTKAFAEVWINPESDEREASKSGEKAKHFLLVIDLDNLGQFEAEVFSYGERMIDFTLHCPPGLGTKFEKMMDNIPVALKMLDYKVGKTQIETIESNRSLMEVFKSLPYKRVGVDVKI